jgi:dihydroflavonol-4-reductase
MAARTVFLTGATGFIGSRLARRLLAAGDRLRCFVRPSSHTDELERAGAELVRGDIADAAALARALAGADLAYHLGAIYDVGVVDARALERTNVGGTAAFLEAVQRSGVPRAVYVSTTAALGPVAEGSGDEMTVHGPRTVSVYERTKVQAHELALDAQARGLPIVIVCPANVYGPGDNGPNGRFMADLIRGRLPGLQLNPAWFSYVHVDDVVEGLVLAGERGSTSGVYVLSGEERSLNDFASEVCRLAGTRPPLLRLPASMAHWTGVVLDAISRLTGAKFSVTRENADTSAGLRWLHTHERATREWGWTPRPLAVGLPDAVRDICARAASPGGGTGAVEPTGQD